MRTRLPKEAAANWDAEQCTDGKRTDTRCTDVRAALFVELHYLSSCTIFKGERGLRYTAELGPLHPQELPYLTAFRIALFEQAASRS